MNALRGEAGVPITIACPGYVDTDFHRRVITASGEPLPGSQRRGISPETCAKICLDAALHGDSEVIFGFSGKLGYALRPLCPDVVDAVARWISLRSIRSPEAKKPEGEDGFEKKE
ncbi:unnamed protein product [Phytomonas sp. EM1]|nr:unnamed protein product [Phytomonas sp. EM1]|eukprot:CCW65665.1 unnamed protein product [Phytomonas sp. isolate EM1]